MTQSIISHLLIFIAAMAFLVKGADYFVEYSGHIAKRLGVSDFIIGLTVTSIGTSLPELASSVSAALNDRPGIIVGNVVGSNIANIGLILGVSALFKGFKTERAMHDRDGFIMLASVVLFFFYSRDNVISVWESLSFLLFYALYLLFIFKVESDRVEVQFRDFMRFVFDFEYVEPIRRRMRRPGTAKSALTGVDPDFVETRSEKAGRARILALEGSVVLLSGLAILVSARYVVTEATWIAGILGVPDNIIGLSLIAVGTSLPELLVSVSAVRQNRGGIVVGNIIGSNIANVLLIFGVCGLIGPVGIAESSVVYTIPIMLFFSLAVIYFIKSDWEVRRSQGAIAIFAYLVFMLVAFTKDWG